MNYLTVPKEIILAEELGPHRVEMYCELARRLTYRGEIYFSPESFIQGMGYSSAINPALKNNIYEQLKNFLAQLSSMGYIEPFELDGNKLKRHYEIKHTNLTRKGDYYSCISDEFLAKHKKQPAVISLFALIYLLSKDDKLDTYVVSLASGLTLSTQTVKNALDQLVKEGYITYHYYNKHCIINVKKEGKNKYARQTDLPVSV